MANTNKKIVLNIDTQISNQKALQGLLTDLKKLQANAGEYGVNLNTVNSALNKTQELLKTLKPTTKVGYSTSITEIQDLEKGYASLAKTLSKLDTQILNNTTTNDEYVNKIKSISEALVKAEKDLAQFKKRQAELEEQTSKQDMNALVGGAIKSRKAQESRKADTKSDKFLRQVTTEGLDLYDPVVKASVDPKVYEEALQTLLQYTAKIEEELAQVNQQVDDTTANITKLNEQLEQAKATPVQDTAMTTALQTNSGELHKQSQEYGQLTEEMKKTGQAQVEVSKHTDQHSNSLGRATKAVLNYQLIYRTLLNMIKQAVSTIKDMDDALTGMSVVTGQSRDEIKQLIPELRQLATETSSTMTDVANLTTEFVRQGRTIKDSLVLAEQTAKAAQVAGISTTDSLQYMTSAINGFNLAATDASRVNDLFAKLGAATATDYENLAVALSKVSAQANTAGMSIEFTTSLLAKGIETTQEAPESIGTALKTILARMREISDYGTSLEDNTSINKVERALGSVGISLRDANGQFRDMEEIFRELGPQWDGLTSMQQQAIAQAVAGTRQQSRFLAIMQDWDRTLEISTASQDAMGESLYQYNKYAESMTASITRLTTAFQGLIQNLVESDLVIGVVNTLENVLNGLNSIVDKLNGNSEEFSLTGMITAFALIGAVVKLLTAEIQKHHTETYNAIQNATDGTQEHQNALASVEKRWMSLTDRVKRYNEECDVINQHKDKMKYSDSEWNKLQALEKQNKMKKDQLKLDLKAGKITKKEYKEQLKKQNESYKKQRKEIKTLKQQKRAQAKQTERDYKAAYNEEIRLTNVAKQNKTYKEDQVKLAKDELMKQQSLNQEQTAITEQLKDQTLTSEQREQFTQRQSEIQGQIQTSQATINGLDQSNVAIAQQQVTQENLKNSKIQEENTNLLIQGGILVKNLAKQVTSTMVEIAKSIASMVGIGFATAAAGLLVSTIGGGIMSFVNSATGKQQREDIKENQDTIYENKSDVNDATDLKKEYEELLLKESKGILTAEDRDRMKDIEDSLHEIDDSIVGTGSSLINSIDAFVRDKNTENTNLINDNYTKFKEILGSSGSWWNWEKDENMEFLKGDEGRMAVAQKLAIDSSLNDQELLQQQQNIFNSLDWERVVQDFQGDAAAFDEFKNNFLNTTSEMLTGMSSLDSDDLLGKTKAYQAAMEKFTALGDEESKKALQRIYGNYEIYGENMETINSLLTSGTLSSGTAVESLVTALTALGTSAAGVGTVLDTLGTEGFDGLYEDLLNYTDEDWARLYYGDEFGTIGKTLEDYQKLGAEKSGFENRMKEVVIANETGFNLADLDDAITTLSSINENRTDIIDKLLNGDALGDEDYKVLDNLGLTADTGFMTALIEDPIKAAMIMQSKAEDSKKETENKINASIARYEEWIKRNEELMQTATDAEKERLQQENETYQAEINVSKARLKNLEAEYDLFTEYEMKVAKRSAIISKLQKQLDKASIGNLDNISALIAEYAAQSITARTQLDSEFANLVRSYDDSLSTKFEDYFEIIDGQAVIIESKYNELLNSGNKAFAEALKARQGDYQDYLDMVLESSEEIQVLRDQVIDDAIANQEFFIDYMKTAYEQEAEALKDSLDKRKEMYDKYFDSLEGEEEAADYENDRQALINRIAKLSTATDSESLKKLKEAQEELNDLNKEYASSQRDNRREAVSERLDSASENVDKQLENILKDYQGMWNDFMTSMEGKDDEFLEEWLTSLGAFDEMTDLMKSKFITGELSEQFGAYQSYEGTGYDLNNIKNIIVELIKPEPKVESTSNNNAITNQVNAQIDKIVIGEGSTYTKDELQTLVKKAFDDSWAEIANQNGLSFNTNPN